MTEKGKFELSYSAESAQRTYENNRKHSVKQCSLTEKDKGTIVHEIKMKWSPEMIVKTRRVTVTVSTIYYWIHHGQLCSTKKDMLYPHKNKAQTKKVSPDVKSAGKSIDERPEPINQRLENSL